MKGGNVLCSVASRLPRVSLGILLLTVFSTEALAQNASEQCGFSPTHIFAGWDVGESNDGRDGIVAVEFPTGPSYLINRNLRDKLRLR